MHRGGTLNLDRKIKVDVARWLIWPTVLPRLGPEPRQALRSHRGKFESLFPGLGRSFLNGTGRYQINLQEMDKKGTLAHCLRRLIQAKIA